MRIKNNMVLHKKGEPSFVTYIKRRIKKNLNFIALFQGPTGIGKTWNAISLAHQLDPSFNPENQVVFSLVDMQKLINEEWFKKKKIKVIVFDEPQVSISNRAWQSIANKSMNFVLSTFRHQNIILLFAAPYKDFMDSQSMRLLHCIFNCQGVNRKKKVSTVIPKLQQYNPDMKKTYQHFVRVIGKNGVIPLKRWHIKKPPQWMIRVYERRKEAFTSELNREILEKFENLGVKDKQKSDVKVPAYKKPLTELQKRIYACWEEGMTVQKEIALKLGKDRSQVGRNIGFMIRKGHTPPEIAQK